MNEINYINKIDCSEKQGKIKIQKLLRSLPPFKKYVKEKNVLNFELIEKVMIMIQMRYKVSMNLRIVNERNSGTHWYSLGFKNDAIGEWIFTVYGLTIYEVFAKALIIFFKNIECFEKAPKKSDFEKQEQIERRKLRITRKKDK